ncbi:hypothetical protein EYZ11_011228 [Aspergillus tanneri]|uniref:Transmembrane protein n=1 Tax=Aspergillus tanneri TaxID=1220188 RepID=A0A4S3J3N6_9EURO|nr:hypothetical protein EYZ11_011228 [Aspergillus tanneri]
MQIPRVLKLQRYNAHMYWKITGFVVPTMVIIMWMRNRRLIVSKERQICKSHQAEEHHHPSPIVNNGYDTLQIAQHPDDTYTYDFDNFLPATPDWSGWYYDFSSNFR